MRLLLILLFLPSSIWADISFVSVQVNLGNISSTHEIVKHTFEFEVNNRPSQIYEVIPDCACSVVSFPTGSLEVGFRGSVVVIYEPYRYGHFEKNFIVRNSDGKEVVLSISGYIEPKSLNPYMEFPYQSGHLRFKSKNINLGKVSGKAPLRRPVRAFNSSDREIRFLDSVIAPRHIEIVFDSSRSVLPGQVYEFLLYYHPEYKNEFGLAQDQVTLFTDYPDSPPVLLNVNATITEIISDTAAAPRMETEQQEIDLGTTYVGVERLAAFKIFNNGSSNLQIHKIIPDNECEFVAISRRVIEPNESAELVVRFKSQSKPGLYRRSITVYSNDPENYVAKFYILVRIAGN